MSKSPVPLLRRIVGDGDGSLRSSHRVLKIHHAGAGLHAIPVVAINADGEDRHRCPAIRHLRNFDGGICPCQIKCRDRDVPVVRPDGRITDWRNLQPLILFEHHHIRVEGFGWKVEHVQVPLRHVSQIVVKVIAEDQRERRRCRRWCRRRRRRRSRCRSWRRCGSWSGSWRWCRRGCWSRRRRCRRGIQNEVIKDCCARRAHRLICPGIKLNMHRREIEIPGDSPARCPIHSIRARCEDNRIVCRVVGDSPVVKLRRVVGHTDGVLDARDRVLKIHLP